ncbi:hypothetical protein IFM46972_09619 [Aspergillus udagawae]|uniref:Mitochondrial distribution and morphology protein 35 n=1 Tax=Aspergillus udagawae TaxID=91492 RepID=A0A8H3XME3_9EURO|nr:hypothetical protein IFM46972_09619 [Aspergillus udagawae]
MRPPEEKTLTAYRDRSSHGISAIVSMYKFSTPKYLRGKTSSNECEELFSKYRSCLHKALKEKGIDTMVEEARKSTASESDADYLRKS